MPIDLKKLAIELEMMLAQATNNCVYRINGLCWIKCRARVFCEPEHHGLKTVDNLK